LQPPVSQYLEQAVPGLQRDLAGYFNFSCPHRICWGDSVLVGAESMLKKTPWASSRVVCGCDISGSHCGVAEGLSWNVKPS